MTNTRSRSAAFTSEMGARRMIRRPELTLLVPLADSTI